MFIKLSTTSFIMIFYIGVQKKMRGQPTTKKIIIIVTRPSIHFQDTTATVGRQFYLNTLSLGDNLICI